MKCAIDVELSPNLAQVYPQLAFCLKSTCTIPRKCTVFGCQKAARLSVDGQVVGLTARLTSARAKPLRHNDIR